MAVRVVDASALAALLFGEPEAEAVAARFEGSGLFAPALLGYEIASVCLKKLRRDPQRRDALLAAFALYARMPIEIVEVDHADTLRLAEAVGLTIYDAAYLWLAQKLAAELVTLDKRLQIAGGERGSTEDLQE
jgi:predicted nucleic acid-binding protein